MDPSVRHQVRGTLATSSQRYWKKFVCRQRLSMVSWTPHDALQTGHWKCSPGTCSSPQFQTLGFTLKAAFGHSPLPTQPLVLR